jgi:hypothetical protein
MSNLIIDLSSWIIQDGNYPDFVRGQQAAFALQFRPTEPLLTSAVEVAPSHAPVGDASQYNGQCDLSG